MRRLIVNADDLGMSPGITRGILEAHDRGVVTSASLMVLQPGAADAAAVARARSGLSVGLHVDTGGWIYVAGQRRPSDPRPPAPAAALEREVTRQLDLFRRLMSREPTHLDSHRHAHLEEPLRSIIRAAGAELRVPVRHDGPVRYCGDFYGQSEEGEPQPGIVTAEFLVELVGRLPEGITEVGCHPGYCDVESSYRAERELEVRALTDPRVRAAIDRAGVELCAFGDVRRGQTLNNPRGSPGVRPLNNRSARGEPSSG